MHAGLGLPPGVHDRAPVLADHVVEPFEGLRVQGLSNGAEDTQGAEVVLVWPLLAEFHEHADRGRGGIEDAHAVLLDHLPPDPGIGIVRSVLRDQDGPADRERPVDYVGMPGDPPGIGSTPVYVALLEIEDVLGGIIDADHVSPAGMHDTLGGPGSPARIEDEHRVLGIHHLGMAIRGHILCHFIEVHLHLAVDLDRTAKLPAQYDEVLDHGGMDDRLFDHVFERD